MQLSQPEADPPLAEIINDQLTIIFNPKHGRD